MFARNTTEQTQGQIISGIQDDARDIIESITLPTGFDRVVEVPHLVEKDIVVEVPEVHHHKILNYRPVYEEREVVQEVQVPEVHHREEVVVVATWQQEEIQKRVPRVTVREVEKPVLVPKTEHTEETVDVPIVLPTFERIIERPNVEVKASVYNVRGETQVTHREETIEVPYTVEVPRIVPVVKDEHQVSEKEVVVPHIMRVDKVVEVPQEQRIEKFVDVPQVHMTKNIRHVPKFYQSDETLGAGQEKTLDEQSEDALRRTTFYIAEVDKTNRELQEQLNIRLEQIRSTKATYDGEMRLRHQLEAQLERAQQQMGKEFSATRIIPQIPRQQHRAFTDDMQCVCGNILTQDSKFCNKCGRPRTGTPGASN